MKKTLLVSLDVVPSRGGVSHYWEMLGSHLPADRWVVLAPLLSHGEQEVITPYRVIRRRLIISFLFPSWLPMILHIIDVVRRERIGMIIVGQILPVGVAVWVASLFLRIPYCVSLHGMDIALTQQRRWKRFLARTVLHSAHHILANSAFTAEIAKRAGAAHESVSILYPCPRVFSHNIIPQVINGENEKRILLSVGRLVKRKGVDNIIRLLPRLRGSIPHLQYIIIGGGPFRSTLDRLIQEKGVGDMVSFLGELPPEEVALWYEKCEIFVLVPHREEADVESFGMVYLEANAFGKPVVASRSGGISEAVQDGITGLLVEEGNDEQLFNAILRLFTDHELANRLGRQGKERVEKEFQWSMRARQLEKILSL